MPHDLSKMTKAELGELLGVNPRKYLKADLVALAQAKNVGRVVGKAPLGATAGNIAEGIEKLALSGGFEEYEEPKGWFSKELERTSRSRRERELRKLLPGMKSRVTGLERRLERAGEQAFRTGMEDLEARYTRQMAPEAVPGGRRSYGQAQYRNPIGPEPPGPGPSKSVPLGPHPRQVQGELPFGPGRYDPKKSPFHWSPLKKGAAAAGGALARIINPALWALTAYQVYDEVVPDEGIDRSMGALADREELRQQFFQKTALRDEIQKTERETQTLDTLRDVSEGAEAVYRGYMIRKATLDGLVTGKEAILSQIAQTPTPSLMQVMARRGLME